MQVKFNVFWKKNLGTLYKDNSIMKFYQFDNNASDFFYAYN